MHILGPTQYVSVHHSLIKHMNIPIMLSLSIIEAMLVVYYCFSTVLLLLLFVHTERNHQ